MPLYFLTSPPSLGDVPLKFRGLHSGIGNRARLHILFHLPPILPAMDARTSATHIPGYSRARLKRMIPAGNVAALAIGFWTIFFPTQLYTVGLSLCVLLPLWALALEIRTRGALGFEARRGHRSQFRELPALDRSGSAHRFSDVRSLLAFRSAA